jgi:FlaA1/EpsC-like NDP-sugar epimerase
LPDRLSLTALLFDATFVLYALLLAFWLRFRSPIQEYGVPDDVALIEYSGYILVGVIAQVLTFARLGLYQRNTLLRYRFVGWQIIRGVIIWTCGLAFVALAFKLQPVISRFYVILSAVLIGISMLVWRYFFHRFLARSSVVESLRQRVVFVGWNEDSESLTRTFQSDPGSAYEVVGCVSMVRTDTFQKEPPADVRLLGSYADLANVVERNAIDIVILTDITSVKEDVVALANLCEREMTQFKIMPAYFQILVSGLHLETVSGVPILGVSRLPLDRFSNIFLKRCVDIVGAIMGLLLSAPLIAIFGAFV